MEAPVTIDVRFIESNGVRYLRADDVAAYILEIASTEETDVRRRLTSAAKVIQTRAETP